MAEKIARPDFDSVKNEYKELGIYLKELQTISMCENNMKSAVRSKIPKAIEASSDETLKTVTVDELNTVGHNIRVSALRNAGINTLYDLSKLSQSRLVSIPGIGQETAVKIKRIADKMIREIRKTSGFKLTVDNLTPESKSLIGALYAYIGTVPLIAIAKELGKQNRQAVNEALSAAKPSKSGFRWFFASRSTKEKASLGIERIFELYTGDFGNSSRELIGRYKYLQTASEEKRIADFEARSSVYYAELEKLGGTRIDKSTLTGGMDEELVMKVMSYPVNLSGLNATLRSYQEFGVKYALCQEKSLLGDEMGLGKTIQAISAFISLAAEGKTHFMVVCPASVVVNWTREIGKFSSLTPHKVHGDVETALNAWLTSGGVAVTTFETISKFDLPENRRIDMLVCDEAHYVKNPEAIRTKALMKICERCERVLFMTGTPIENRVEEMCFLVSCLQSDIATELEKIKYLSKAAQFRKTLAPVYLRRTRAEVLKELPELIETEEWCEMNSTELSMYREAVKAGNFMAMRQVSWNVADGGNSQKAARLLELCDEAREEGRKIIVFSFFRNTVNRVIEILGDRCIGPITGDISLQKRQELVDEFTAAPTGSVLVSQVQAGGTGLNIQAASVVIFCEPQIKPSIEDQAMSRAYRMGQTRNVEVFRLLSDESVDERILEILKNKQEIFDKFADESVVATEAEELTESALSAQIIEEEKKRLGITE
ncbi:MAG: RNA helicase [Ruminococcaceae bacterium]|nr:RNA helicase [Oscillospiraceae bacterium]